MKWAALEGRFEFQNTDVVFKGEPTPWTDPKDPQSPQRIGYAPGLALTSGVFAGGKISAEVEFDKISPLNSCEIVFFYDPARKIFLSAGLGYPPVMYCIRQWDGVNGVSTSYAMTGDRRNLASQHPYLLSVNVQGSRVTMLDDSVEVLSAVLPFPVPPSQVGLYCFDDTDIKIRSFRPESRPGQVFVVMQFSSPFNEIYDEVIKRVCLDLFQLEARRADDATGPGLVMADVVNDIVESEFVIAEITPTNPNVYYELGYAHAIGKPVIMLANRRDLPRLPFDIAAARVLFYEDSIAGRRKFEEQLARHIEAILQKRTVPSGRGGLT